MRTLIGFALDYPVSSVLAGLGTREQVDAAMGWDARNPKPQLPSFEEVLSVLEKSTPRFRVTGASGVSARTVRKSIPYSDSTSIFIWERITGR